MSRQNSREVSSLDVTLIGDHQIDIESIGNGTKPFDDVKVMLVKGLDGAQSPYTSTPNMDGVGSAGISDLYARGDHVHPSDQSKVNVNGDIMFGDLSVVGYKYPTTETKSAVTVTKIEVEYQSDTSRVYYTCYNGSTTPSYLGVEDGTLDQACFSIYDSTGNTLIERAFLSEGDSKTFNFDTSTDVKISLMFLGYSEIGTDVKDARGNVLKDKVSPVNLKYYPFEIIASNWSVSPNASGYYTYTLSLSGIEYNTDVVPIIRGGGASGVPTDDEMEAYEHIVLPNGYVEQVNATSFKLYAKEKPTTDFWIRIYGVSTLLPF